MLCLDEVPDAAIESEECDHHQENLGRASMRVLRVAFRVCVGRFRVVRSGFGLRFIG